MSSTKTKTSTNISPRGSKKTGGRFKPAGAIYIKGCTIPSNSANLVFQPTKVPDPEAFKRGQGMGQSFLDGFGADEMRDGLQGFHAAVRERLKESIDKQERVLDFLHGAMEVAEDR